MWSLSLQKMHITIPSEGENNSPKQLARYPTETWPHPDTHTRKTRMQLWRTKIVVKKWYMEYASIKANTAHNLYQKAVSNNFKISCWWPVYSIARIWCFAWWTVSSVCLKWHYLARIFQLVWEAGGYLVMVHGLTCYVYTTKCLVTCLTCYVCYKWAKPYKCTVVLKPV